MNILPRLADRVIGRPLLLHPDKVSTILSVLSGRIGIDVSDLRPQANRLEGEAVVDRDEEGFVIHERYRKVGSTALVTVDGSLVNRGAWVGANSGLQSYEGIAYQVRSAAQADDVSTIVLDIDSPGGEATGMYRLAETIRAVRSEKRVIAYIDDIAASAAYGIAAGAHEIVVSPTSIVGSIGVVLVHADRSGEMEEAGIKPTLIFSGAHKVDGHPFGPLPDSVRSDLQREVDLFYDRFVETVAHGRSNLMAEAIRATEARTYIGQDAVDIGLADRIASLDDVIAEFSRGSGRISSRTQGGFMSAKDNATPDAEKSGITLEEHNAAIAAARSEGEKAGASAERERISAILGGEEAKGREALARHFAFATDMAPDAATAALAASAKAGGEADPGTDFERRKEQAAAGASLDLGGPIKGEKPKSGLSKAVDRLKR